ncbi:MAG TPA: aminotransferase class I/II-fold pyridoxal phosphate-dependent enzyme [Patescibacteria group bacterium]
MSDEKIYLQYTTLTTPLPNFIYDGLKSFSTDANSYHPQPAQLIEKISKKHRLPKEMIYLTAGADEAIYMFGLAYGNSVYCFTPTYITYEEITNIGANVNFINALKESDYQISTDKIDNATLIFLANPNNPFGLTQREKVIELIENNSHAIVVIDEVYAEFENVSVIDLVQKYSNLVVLRSFAKSYGMAGNRVAYVVANDSILKKIKTKAQWASLSYLSAGAAIVAMDHDEYFIGLIESVSKRREEFQDFLKEKKYSILPTKINAVLIKFLSEEEATKFVEHLNANNFVVSHGNGGSNVGLDKSFVRISIGTQEEIAKLKEAINSFGLTL